MGYLSSRVLGQYDVSLLGAETEPRLLFVDANLNGAVRDLDVDADSFGRWICAHGSRTSSSSRACPGCAST